MDYETFRTVFTDALRVSGLRRVGLHDTEGLELRSLDRTYDAVVEPVDHQDADPFFVTASLSWRWSALHTARTRTHEEDVLVEMLGREETEGGRTERPWLRMDIKLVASLPWGKPLPMPSSADWSEWIRATMTRFRSTEPLTPREKVESVESGRLKILAWDGEPVMHACCTAGGELRLQQVEICAWQSIELPRALDDPEQPSDPRPERQVASMLARIRAALGAWMESLEHLHR